MKSRNNITIFDATNSLKVLSFMADNPGKEFLASEIQKATSLSRGGVYIAVRELIKEKLVVKIPKGKFFIYSVAYNEPTVKQFKVLRNILFLNPIIAKLKISSKKLILYGSAGRGEDYSNSDIDLFVLSKDPEATKNTIASIKVRRKIQVVIKSPSEFASLKESDNVFYEEVNRGIVIWEEKE